MPFDGDVRRFERPEWQPQQPRQSRHYTAVAIAAGMGCWGITTLAMAMFALYFADIERALWFFAAACVMFAMAAWLLERQVRQLYRAIVGKKAASVSRRP